MKKLMSEQGFAKTGTAKFNAKYHFLTTFTSWAGSKILIASVCCKSMDSASDRKHVRRVANEMLRLCDEAEA